MKYVKLRIVIVLIIIVLFVQGCDSKSEEHVFNGVIHAQIDGMYMDDAVIYVDGGLVHYCDYETGVNTILCNNVACVHEPYSKTANPNPVCMAALPYSCCYMAKYENNIYYITSSFEYTGTTDIYVEDGGSGGRKLLVSVPYEITSIGGHGAPMLDGVLYIKLRERIINETTGMPELFVVLVAIDLKSGEYEVILPAKIYEEQKIPYMEVRDRYLYYCVDNYNAEKDKIERMLFRYDSETKESIKVMDEEAFVNYSFYGVHEDKVFVGERDGNVIYEYNQNVDKMVEILRTDDSEIARCVSLCGYLLYYTKDGKENDVWQYYNLTTGESGVFSRPDTEAFFIITFATENTIFTDLDNSGGSASGVVVMNIDDYIEGNKNYLFELSEQKK